MSPELANFLFEAANFLVLAAALSWLLFKPVRTALGAERDRRAAEEAEAAKVRDEANALMKQAEATRQSLEDELETRKAQMLEAARAEVARIKEAARQQQLAEARALTQKHEAGRRAQIDELADALGEIAAASVRGLLEAVAGPDLDLALVRAVCRELSALPTKPNGSPVVESARPLDPAARELLEGVLGSGFDARTVPELGAGIRVTTAAGQVDGSATRLAREAAHHVAGAVHASAIPAPEPEGAHAE